MNNEFQGDAAAKARRRLIRGAFAAPAALTLVSGSVYAAASSQRCLANAIQQPVNAPVNPGDTWLRVKLYTRTEAAIPPATQGTPSTWVKGADMVNLRASGGDFPYLSGTQWQVVSPGSSGFAAGAIKEDAAVNPKPAGNGQYVAVRVNAAGKVIGVQGLETSGSALSLVCWASFVGVV